MNLNSADIKMNEKKKKANHKKEEKTILKQSKCILYCTRIIRKFRHTYCDIARFILVFYKFVTNGTRAHNTILFQYTCKPKVMSSI